MEENKKDGHFRSNESRSDYGQRPERVYSSSRPYHRSSEQGDGQRRNYSQDRERRPRFRSNDGGRPYYSTTDNTESPRRSQYGSDRPRYSSNGERRSYGSDRPRYGSDGERRSYSNDRPRYGSDGERRSYGSDRPRYGSDGEKRSYGDRERRPYGDSRGERRSDHRSEGFRDRRTGDRRTGDFRKTGDRRTGDFRRPFVKRDNDSGINKMLSRKPQLDMQAQISENDIAQQMEMKDSVRLNKFIANSGMCSRREADNFIQAGVVTVNGEIITELGVKINPMKDEVKFNGERLKGEEKVYIVMNKPKGFVTTASDPHAEKTVMDLLKGCNARVFPVGRLDKNTTGVLMFTNDGEIAEKLTHPSYNKKKIYQVTLDNKLSQEDFDKVLSGVMLQDGEVAADDLEYIDENDHRKLGIEIHSGKNRIVRRIFESLGYEVKALDRVYFAGLTKKNLKKGEWRFLTTGEANLLKMGAYV